MSDIPSPKSGLLASVSRLLASVSGLLTFRDERDELHEPVVHNLSTQHAHRPYPPGMRPSGTRLDRVLTVA